MVTGIPSLCLWLPETLLQDLLILPRVVHRKEEQVFLVQNVVGEDIRCHIESVLEDSNE